MNAAFKLVGSRYSRQHTQAGPDPVFGLALGLRAKDPALNGYAGPAGPGGKCGNHPDN
jgi:hypothetical protein